MPKHEVVVKSSRDDDTESLFVGTFEEAKCYLSGYVDALIIHTAYVFLERNIEEGYAYMRSYLISEEDLILNIIQRPA